MAFSKVWAKEGLKPKKAHELQKSKKSEADELAKIRRSTGKKTAEGQPQQEQKWGDN